MYSAKNLVFICTALERVEKVFLYTKIYQSAQELVEADDQRDYNAAWSMLLVIGEETKKIDTNLKSEHSSIPCNNIAGMRNFLAHDYRGLDYDLVYKVIRDNLPELKDELISMIGKVSYDPENLHVALDSPYYRHVQYLRNKLNDQS